MVDRITWRSQVAEVVAVGEDAVVQPGLDVGARRKWLEYAWRVVNTDSAHLDWCRSKGGSPDASQRHAPAWMRWPGYVGARWTNGTGLLFVGSVHREFDIGPTKRPEPLLAELEHGLIEANRAWREAGRATESDTAYLTRTQEAFGAMWQLWPRARVFSDFVDGLGLSTDGVAWTNLAKCQVFKSDRTLGRRLSANQENLQAGCQALFPIAEVIDALQPRHTFIPVEQVAKRATLPVDASIYVYHGLHGTRGGENSTVWVPRELGRMRDDRHAG